MAPPQDAFKAGTRLQVGAQQVVVTRYLSHGGFAQVYLCSWNGTTACLKRVVVPDKPSLNTLRKEVDAMRRLKGLPHIVSYVDSNAARANNGYEVLVLMEYCPQGGLIDFMNSRLVQRLSEAEVLSIMAQITQAVAYMHALSPPIVHRDIKIENVLLASEGEYKLCDFGSSTAPLPAPANVEQFQALQDDIMKNTTPQYRAPEMLDLYRRQPIDEKSDVWALGVFMYKLCYYTTPFESNNINGHGNAGGGDYAILHCIYSFPPHPNYSPRLKNIISKILVADPKLRPSVYQLLDELCKMRGVPTPPIAKQAPKNLPSILMPSASPSAVSLQSQAQGPQVSQVPQVPQGPPGPIQIPMHTPLQGSLMTPKKSTTIYSSASSVLSNGDSMYSGVSRGDPQVPVSRSKSVRTPRRPVSMYGSSSELVSSSKDDLSNLINELKFEDVRLSPEAESRKGTKAKKGENISSSMDFLRTLSRQNTNKTGGQSDQQQSTGSKWRKRSSISSLKDLLTGGSSSGTGNQSSSRRSSMEINTPRRTKSNNGSSLEDLKEMSPENKNVKKLPLETNTTGAKKKMSLIQERTARLFRKASGGESERSAHGYGKYTDLNVASATKTFKTPSPEPLPMRIPTRDIYETPKATTTPIALPKTEKRPAKAPPPKPKKPTFLQSANLPKKNPLDDLDIMEAKFHSMFPPPPRV